MEKAVSISNNYRVFKRVWAGKASLLCNKNSNLLWELCVYAVEKTTPLLKGKGASCSQMVCYSTVNQSNVDPFLPMPDSADYQQNAFSSFVIN